MPHPLLPPRYINVPPGIVFDKDISGKVKDTYFMLRGLAWASKNVLRINWMDLQEITGKPRATIYKHLAELRLRGWLLFSSSHTCTLIVEFTDPDPDQGESSQKRDSLNEDVNLTDSPFKQINHPPINNSLKLKTVSKMRQSSQNLDSSNGWHDIINDELAEMLDRIGVYREKFIDVASSGWEPWQLRKLAETVLEELGPGEGGGIFLYRLINRKPPETEEDYRKRYFAGDWGAYVEH